jgi:hypothetical protein
VEGAAHLKIEVADDNVALDQVGVDRAKSGDEGRRVEKFGITPCSTLRCDVKLGNDKETPSDKYVADHEGDSQRNLKPLHQRAATA